MNSAGLLSIVIFASFWSKCTSKYNIDDSTLYAIRFNPLEDLKTKEENKNTVNEHDESLLNAPSLLQTVTMTTNHNEKYVCELPKEEVKLKQSDEEYNVRLY